MSANHMTTNLAAHDAAVAALDRARVAADDIKRLEQELKAARARFAREADECRVYRNLYEELSSGD